ncbi:DUF1614 domain-containing protein [Desulfocurvus sp.]|jgi:uncharacterized membrane protein|uniref:DUF1614 domain-containing protein n=1 Tax=Desulfocurvus sp. TaxID=2871698 RepID=UPI0025BC3D41|nr:DUF1614 domain-containing protein [Desulfocurvus sp.]MCK9240701.1 DUF1614 domain-containing protein [Desulfocurvus sp.]
MRPQLQFPLVLLALLGFVGLLVLLFILVQVGLVTLAFAKLGLTPLQGFALLFATLLGSGVNIPVAETGHVVKRPVLRAFPGFGHFNVRTETELVPQVVAVNLGGCIIPCLLCLYLVSGMGASAGLLLATGAVAALCYALARPVPGRGIAVPVLLPPLATALAALILAPQGQAAPVAYVAGTLGTLVGADLLHLATPRTRRVLDAAVLSIGGAGTFDGIFITGIVAVLLA